MQHEAQFRTAFTRILALEHEVLESEIKLSLDAVPDTVVAHIKGERHDYRYIEALEKAFSWTFQTARGLIHNYYPVADLHRDDIREQHGHYVAAQLSETEIESLSYAMWNDSLSDAYWDSIDWIVEDSHPELVKHPHARMEKRLKLATVRFQLFDFGDLEDGDLFAFLEELVQIEETGAALSDRELARRFLDYLSAQATIPSHTSYEKLNAILQAQHYEDAVLALFDKAIQDDHPQAAQLQKSRLRHYGIRAEIQAAFQAGTSPERAFDQLLPVAVDRIEKQAAKQIEFENSLRRNRTLDSAHELQDPESKQWITVKINASYTGCTLRFPDLNHENQAGGTVEVIVGIDFYNDELHALINNADFQQEPQMVYLGTLIAED